VDAAQAGVLTQALEFVGVPLMADGGAVFAYRDQTVIGPPRAESLCFGLLLRVSQDDDDGVIRVDDDPIRRTAPLGVLSGAVVGVVTALPSG
jgi:hypothetical protein